MVHFGFMAFTMHVRHAASFVYYSSSSVECLYLNERFTSISVHLQIADTHNTSAIFYRKKNCSRSWFALIFHFLVDLGVGVGVDVDVDVDVDVLGEFIHFQFYCCCCHSRLVLFFYDCVWFFCLLFQSPYQKCIRLHFSGNFRTLTLKKKNKLQKYNP